MTKLTRSIEIPYNEDVGPCSWLYEELKDVKPWYERHVRHKKLAGDVDRRAFLKDVRSARVTFFGVRRLRSGEEKIYKVNPTIGCDNLHHIEISGWNEDVLQCITQAINGCLNASLKTGNPCYHGVFDAPNLRPTKYMRLNKTFDKVWNFGQEDEENKTLQDHVFREEFDYLSRYEKKYFTEAWLCSDRNMIVIQGDNESSVLRVQLRVRDFITTKIKQLTKATKNKATKATETKKQTKFPESKHFFDWNNPYTLLSKFGFGEKYMN